MAHHDRCGGPRPTLREFGGGAGQRFDGIPIAGFEDSPFSKQSWPALTTARQATTQITQHATRLLLAQLDEDAAARIHNQGFSPELVVRGSTAPPRPDNNPKTA